jgi:tetratricopeptide (TPR) repeat protein
MRGIRLCRIRRVTQLLVFVSSLCTVALCAAQTALEQAQKLLAAGHLNEGVAMLHQIIKRDPDDSQAHLILGTALAVEGLRNESIEQMDIAVRLSPNSADAYNQLGTILSRFLDGDEARGAFEKALALDPHFAQAHVNLALVLAQEGDYTSAHEHLDRAIELEGNSKAASRAYFVRAMVWSAQGNNDGAIADLKKATQLRPDYEAAWFDLSQLLYSKSDVGGALSAAERAVAIDPKDAAAQYQIGRLYLDDGNSAKALTHLRAAQALGANDTATLYALERALRATGDLEQAKQVEKQVVQLDHKSVKATQVLFTASSLNNEGVQLEKSGDLPAALAKYKAALDLDPTGYGYRLNYGLALCRLGRWEEGILQLRQVLKADPNNADAAKALYIAQDNVAKKMRTRH